MPYIQNQFDQAIWKIVSKIPVGQVMGYGEVARAAGFPRHARMVSKAMSRSPTPLPWYRVVRTNRTLAFEVGSSAYGKQKKLLEKEGVQILNGKIVSAVPSEPVDLDKLLWGPNE